MEFIEEKRAVHVKLECDVLIAGGGTSGVIAAIAAARNGANTVLVESKGFLGGTMIDGAGPLHSFFNMYKAFPGVGKKQLVRGIPQEIIDRMIAAGGSLGHIEAEKGFSYDSVITIIDSEIFKNVIFTMIQEANVKLMLHTLVVDVIKEGNAIKGLIIESKAGREALLSKVVIDTTGDADVAYKSGANCNNMFPDGHVGMPFGMANVDIMKFTDYLNKNDMVDHIIHANKGSDTDNVVRLGFSLNKIDAFKTDMEKHGMWGPLTVSRHEGDLSYINCTNIAPLDALNPDEITRAEIVLRGQVMTMSNLLKKHIPGFENAYLSWTPTHFGVRRTRIVECEHDLSIDEVLSGARFSDEIALYGFHDCAPRIMIKDGGAYGIPYRALLPKNIENLFVAGRMISSNWEAHMSTRNTVSCMAQGQAVGTAAALCCKTVSAPRNLDTDLLRKTLISDGVYLG